MIDEKSRTRFEEHIYNYLSPKHLQDKWSRHFRFYDFFMTLDPRYLATLTDHISELEGFNEVIDTGSGSGNLTLELLKAGHNVTAVDLNEHGLKLLKQKCTNYSGQLEVIQQDLNNLKINWLFDAASSIFVVPFVNDNLNYFTRVYNLLKPGGKLIVTAWAPAEDTWKGVIEHLEFYLESQGVFEEKVYRDYWMEFKKTCSVLSKIVLAGPEIKKLEKLLEDIGFKNIIILPSHYDIYAYSLIARKPIPTNQ